MLTYLFDLQKQRYFLQNDTKQEKVIDNGNFHRFFLEIMKVFLYFCTHSNNQSFLQHRTQDNNDLES